MRIVMSVALVLAAQTATADPLGLNNYTRLFEKNAPNLEVADNGDLMLKMPGQVALLRQAAGPSGNYTGVDFSKSGSVGCAATLYASIEAIATTCEGAFTAEQVDMLDTYRSELLDYYADNTYPVASREGVQVAYDAYVQRLKPKAPEFCAAFGGDRQVFFNYMTSAEMRPDFDALLSTPRLPVSNPCL